MEVLGIILLICLPIFGIIAWGANLKKRAYREIEAYGERKQWLVHDIAIAHQGNLPIYKVTYQAPSGKAFLAEVIVTLRTLYWSDPKPLANLPSRSLSPTRAQWKIELDRLNEPDAFERRNAIKELVLIGEDNPLIAQALNHVATHDNDPHIRQTALRALEQLP